MQEIWAAGLDWDDVLPVGKSIYKRPIHRLCPLEFAGEAE
jgi:hypothetical protein